MWGCSETSVSEQLPNKKAIFGAFALKIVGLGRQLTELSNKSLYIEGALCESVWNSFFKEFFKPFSNFVL